MDLSGLIAAALFFGLIISASLGLLILRSLKYAGALFLFGGVSLIVFTLGLSGAGGAYSALLGFGGIAAAAVGVLLIAMATAVSERDSPL